MHSPFNCMAHIKHKHVPSVDVKHMDHHLVIVEGRNRQVCKQAFTSMKSLSKIYYINHGSLQKIHRTYLLYQQQARQLRSQCCQVQVFVAGVPWCPTPSEKRMCRHRILIYSTISGYWGISTVNLPRLTYQSVWQLVWLSRFHLICCCRAVSPNRNSPTNCQNSLMTD